MIAANESVNVSCKEQSLAQRRCVIKGCCPTPSPLAILSHRRHGPGLCRMQVESIGEKQRSQSLAPPAFKTQTTRSDPESPGSQ